MASCSLVSVSSVWPSCHINTSCAIQLLLAVKGARSSTAFTLYLNFENLGWTGTPCTPLNFGLIEVMHSCRDQAPSQCHRPAHHWPGRLQLPDSSGPWLAHLQRVQPAGCAQARRRPRPEPLRRQLDPGPQGGQHSCPLLYWALLQDPTSLCMLCHQPLACMPLHLSACSVQAMNATISMQAGALISCMCAVCRDSSA